MKRSCIPAPVLIQAMVIALIVSACGTGGVPPATSTNTVDLQGTIAAAAWTVIAETQAAIPTATIPPTATITNTPAPTATFLPLPTQGPSPTPLPGAGDPCINQVLPASLVGNTIRIRMDNPIRAPIMISVYLQQAGPQSQCGYRSYALQPQQTLVISDLVEGCYTIWAWNPDPDDYFMVTNGTSCLDTSKTWTFDISTSSIRLRN
jgi:hypothetical protein